VPVLVLGHLVQIHFHALVAKTNNCTQAGRRIEPAGDYGWGGGLPKPVDGKSPHHDTYILAKHHSFYFYALLLEHAQLVIHPSGCNVSHEYFLLEEH
jgi:hypothetical protein